MDTLRTIEADDGSDDEIVAEPEMDPPPAIGGDERRMHVRAYNYWASLLAGREFPSIADLDPASIGDFGPHGVLLDFSGSHNDPAIPWLGKALRDEGGHAQPIATLADVPGRSLLSRLTDQYLDVVANRAPIGFEAEFVNARGNHALYRGILMPFSSDGVTIDYLYGVINWKEVADVGLVAGIVAEVAQAVQPAPRAAAAPVQAWADGPSRSSAAPVARPVDTELSERLAAAREGADAALMAEAQARNALYRALGQAYDLAMAAQAMPDGVETLLGARAGASMLPFVRLVFDAEESSARLSQFASALAYGRRIGIAPGSFRMMLERREGGLRAIVADERAARRMAATDRQS